MMPYLSTAPAPRLTRVPAAAERSNAVTLMQCAADDWMTSPIICSDGPAQKSGDSSQRCRLSLSWPTI